MEETKENKTKEESKEEITKDMMIGDVVQKYPETAVVMMKSGMHCVGCHVAAHETVEQGCKGHGMDDKQVDVLVKEMNKVIKKKEKTKEE
jgi:hybrid cluster-associated redox disulfide protein